MNTSNRSSAINRRHWIVAVMLQETRLDLGRHSKDGTCGRLPRLHGHWQAEVHRDGCTAQARY